MELISRLKDHLGIDTPLVRASSLNCVGKRSEHLLNICQALQCHYYLSPAGSQEYLQVDGFAQQQDVALEMQRFNPAPYPQHRSGEFVSHLSVVDVLANLGQTATRDYIQIHRDHAPEQATP